jgi:outer membrane lipoprotein
MVSKRTESLVILCLFLLLITGCAYPISQRYRREARKDLTFSMAAENPAAYVGSTVIWGGRIIKTENGKEESKIFVLQIPLDHLEEPEDIHNSRGRFIAKTEKFLDPEIYRKGRELTLAGEIIGKETLPLGKTEYTYPVVVIKQLRLWLRRYVYPPPFYYDWGYYRFWPYYGYGPYYGWPDYGNYWVEDMD